MVDKCCIFARKMAQKQKSIFQLNTSLETSVAVLESETISGDKSVLITRKSQQGNELCSTMLNANQLA